MRLFFPIKKDRLGWFLITPGPVDFKEVGHVNRLAGFPIAGDDRKVYFITLGRIEIQCFMGRETDNGRMHGFLAKNLRSCVVVRVGLNYRRRSIFEVHGKTRYGRPDGIDGRDVEIIVGILFATRADTTGQGLRS